MATAPLKVDSDADALASDCAHFLGTTKKQFASDAIRAYAKIRRAEIQQGVQAAMDRLDGTSDAKVAVLSGLSDDELEELGGLS